MHPVITLMTDIINLTDALLASARNDEWDGFDEQLKTRQTLLNQLKEAGTIESAVADGFGELAADLIKQITEQNEAIFDAATQKRENLTQEMRQLSNGDKLKSAYKA